MGRARRARAQDVSAYPGTRRARLEAIKREAPAPLAPVAPAENERDAARRGSTTPREKRGSSRGSPTPSPGWAPVLELLDGLRAIGLDGVIPQYGVAVVPLPRVPAPLVPHLLEHRVALAWIEAGRRSGHAPGTCSECGWIQMLAVVAPSGTRRGLKSAPWPRCHDSRCGGEIRIRDADREGVKRVKRPTKRRTHSHNAQLKPDAGAPPTDASP